VFVDRLNDCIDVVGCPFLRALLVVDIKAFLYILVWESYRDM
jgi:hypothetical protein